MAGRVKGNKGIREASNAPTKEPDAARRNTRMRFEQWAKNPACQANTVSAVRNVRMSVVGGLPAALARMKEAGIWVVGLDDDADRGLFELGDLSTDGICLVLGAEGAGLSRLVRERCDLIVSIPMLGRLSSLNVSAAGALAVYEVARHRAG